MEHLRASAELAFQRLRGLDPGHTALVVGTTVGSVWLASKVLRELSSYAFPNILPGEPNTILLASPRPATKARASASDVAQATTYDYIIVGTGTAGCVLAARLSADPAVRVLAIEAGHSDAKQLMSRIPAGFSNLFHTGADWDLRTTPQPGCAARRMYWPRGKMIGGCSSINAMIYNRGSPADYDEWARLGNAGWDYASVKPYMQRAECFTNATDPRDRVSPADEAQHGKAGPWQIGYSYITDISRVFLDACVAAGLPARRDFNTKDGMNGVGRDQVFVDQSGQRSSAATAYLTADVVRRPNLKIASGQTVTRVVFDESGPRPRAVGVEMAASRDAPVKYLAHASREVIVSAGAVHTPQVLKLSGLGPAKELAAHGIRLLRDLPGLGANLADHIFVNWTVELTQPLSLQRLTSPLKSLPDLIEWLRHGTGAMTANVADALAFLRTADMPDAPAALRDNDLSSGRPDSSDLELLAGGLAYIEHGGHVPTSGDYVSMGPIMLRPQSRGTVTLANSDVFAPPVVDPNYLSTPHDIAVLVYGMKLARRIARAKPMQPVFRRWYPYGPWPADVDGMDDDAIATLVRAACETLYHAMGTARMGPAADGGAVVDAQLRVHGVESLRIVDASVFPTVLACHPCAPVIMVAEKAADLIKGAAA